MTSRAAELESFEKEKIILLLAGMERRVRTGPSQTVLSRGEIEYFYY